MASSQCRMSLLFLIILLSVVQFGESALKCYNCTEAIDSACKDPYKKGANIECPFSDQVCVKHKTPSTDLKVTGHSLIIQAGIMRGCRAKDYCTTVKDYSEYCTTCTKDLCNTSVQVTPSLAILMIVMLIKNFVE